MAATATTIDIVRRRLQHYADQGVFQAVGEQPGRLGKVRFSFRWLLNHEFNLVVDPGNAQLTVSNLLPAIQHRSAIDTDLRRFVTSRKDAALPEHRRMNPDWATLKYVNRAQTGSLVLQLKQGQQEQAISALLGVLNDLFTHLHLYQIDYLHRQFGLPEE